MAPMGTRRGKTLKKRKWLIWLILLLLIAAGVGAYLYFSRGTSAGAYSEENAITGDLTTYYNFDGTVYAPRMQTITAEETDTVDRVYVTQNQQVKDGDRLYATKNGRAVRADMDGEVTGLFVTEGDVLSAGQTAVEIIDLSRLEAHLNVDEYDVGAVAPGAQVDVKVLARETTYTGSVSALNKNGTASGDLSYYTATVPLPQDAQDVYPGMQISANVLRGHVEGAVLLHVSALQFNEYNEPFVTVKTGENTQEDVPVTVGVSDGVYCEIITGVTEGDTVLVPSGLSMLELMMQMDSKMHN